MHDPKAISRREAIKRTVVITAAAGLAACDTTGPTSTPASQPDQKTQSKPVSNRMPVVFLPHGGGPWPFVHKPMGTPGMWDDMSTYMKGLSIVPPTLPKAILIVSAHWETPVPTVLAAPKPPMLYDYHNFPPEAYEVEWPAPGAPEVAEAIRTLLGKAGLRSASDITRGFDHGTFVPLKLAYPKANVPTLQLSLKQGLNPAEHLAIGRALAPLRDQGVFIVGSGMSYHNLRAIMRFMRGGEAPIAASKAFDDWIAESLALGATQRETRLIEWDNAPAARACHPREEHLLPLHVIVGAAGDDLGTLPYRDVVMGSHISAAHFG